MTKAGTEVAYRFYARLPTFPSTCPKPGPGQSSSQQTRREGTEPPTTGPSSDALPAQGRLPGLSRSEACWVPLKMEWVGAKQRAELGEEEGNGSAGIKVNTGERRGQAATLQGSWVSFAEHSLRAGCLFTVQDQAPRRAATREMGKHSQVSYAETPPSPQDSSPLTIPVEAGLQRY